VSRERVVRLVDPHQLFEEHREAGAGTRFVVVEDDLMYRQYPFHAQKLVLRRASLRRFAARLAEAGFEVDVVETDPGATSGARLAELIQRRRPTRISVFDVVDDWLARDITGALRDAGLRLRPEDVLESPNFLTSRAQLHAWFGSHLARMQHFYSWQRVRLDVLVDGEAPVGGRWSFDADNRNRLPKGHPVPRVDPPARHPEVLGNAMCLLRAEPDAVYEWFMEMFVDPTTG